MLAWLSVCSDVGPADMPLPLAASCFSKIQIGFTLLVPAHPGSSGQRAVKCVRVCVCHIMKSMQCTYPEAATNKNRTRRLYILCWRQHSRPKLSPTLATPTTLALTTLVAQCELSYFWRSLGGNFHTDLATLPHLE